MLRRMWDFLVGAFMTLIGLSIQAGFAVGVVGLLCGALGSRFGIQSETWIWIVCSVSFVAMNSLTFYEFRRNRITRLTEHDIAGAFFLFPRGVYRMVFGREYYAAPPADAEPSSTDDTNRVQRH